MTRAAEREADEAGDRWERSRDESYHRSIDDMTPSEYQALIARRWRKIVESTGDWDG